MSVPDSLDLLSKGTGEHPWHAGIDPGHHPVQQKPSLDKAEKIFYFNFCTLESTAVDPSKMYYQEVVVQEQSCGSANSNKKGKKIKEKNRRKKQKDKDCFSAPALVGSTVESLQAPARPLPPLRSLPPLQSFSPMQSQLATQSLPPLQSPWTEKHAFSPSLQGSPCSSEALEPLGTPLKAPDSSQRCSPVGLSQEDCLSPSLSEFEDVEDKFSEEEDSDASETTSWLEKMKPKVQVPLDTMEAELELVSLSAKHSPVPHTQPVALAPGPLDPLRSLPPLPTLWSDADVPFFSHHGLHCESEALELPETLLNAQVHCLSSTLGTLSQEDCVSLSLSKFSDEEDKCSEEARAKVIKARGVSPMEKTESELQELQQVELSVNSTELPSQDTAHSWPQPAVDRGDVSQGRGLQPPKEKNKGQLKELRTEAGLKVEKQKLDERRKADLEALMLQNKELLEAERQRLLREREEQLKTLRSELGGLLQEVRQELQQEHKQMVEFLREEHNQELTSIRENHLAEREKLLLVLQEERRRLLAAHSSHQEDLHVQLELKLQKMCQEWTLKEAELIEQGQQLELRSKELKAQTAALHAQVEDLKMIRQRLGDEEKEIQREKEIFSCLLQQRDVAQVQRSHLQEEVQRVWKERDQVKEEGQRLGEEKLSSQLENKVKVLQEQLDQLSHRISGLKCNESTREPVSKCSLSSAEVYDSTADVQKLTKSVQQLSGQLNTVLGALDCLAQRQTGILPPAQTSYTSLPSPLPHSVSHVLSYASSQNLKKMLNSQWNKILPDRYEENTVMHSAYSGYTPASELSRCLCSTLPKLAEVESQRVQALIESNRRWLEGHRRDSNMSAVSQMKNPPYVGRLVQFSLDERNEIIVHQF